MGNKKLFQNGPKAVKINSMSYEFKYLMKKSYLKAIENSVGTNIFRNFYVKNKAGRAEDILKNGRLSCAVHTSSILYLYGFISSSHATVEGLIKDMKKNGWKKIGKPSPGDVLIWEKKMLNGSENLHSGFYIGNKKAISNDWQKKRPQKHHWTYGTDKNNEPIRRVISIYRH